MYKKNFSIFFRFDPPPTPPPPPPYPNASTISGGLIRDAVSKVRRVLPGNREDECDPPPCIDPNDAVAVAAATAAVAAGAGGAVSQGTSSFSGDGGSSSEQGSSFVEAVREAAAALDVAGAKEVGSRLAEKVRKRRRNISSGCGAGRGLWSSATTPAWGTYVGSLCVQQYVTFMLF